MKQGYSSRVNKPRMVQDTDKRVREMVDKLEKSEFTEAVGRKVIDLSAALMQGNYGKAREVYTSLSSTAPYDQNKNWLTGMNRALLEMEKAG